MPDTGADPLPLSASGPPRHGFFRHLAEDKMVLIGGVDVEAEAGRRWNSTRSQPRV
jgi:hypothetical protein